MKAMIFAAGLGTRLRPMTDSVPKALLKVGGKPLLERLIGKLIQAGFDEITINIHHLPDQIRQFLEENKNFGIRIHISDESDQLLDTGGGLQKAAPFLRGDEPVLLHNVDIVSNLDLNKLVGYHLEMGALATLAVRDRVTERYLLFSQRMRLCGWMNKTSGETRAAIPDLISESIPLAFSGIHVIDPHILDLISGQGKFSMIDTYLKLTKSHPVIGYPDQSTCWMDIGKPGQFREADNLLLMENGNNGK
jgi:NDP-sugar pyrophosphorylase family protein